MHFCEIKSILGLFLPAGLISFLCVQTLFWNCHPGRQSSKTEKDSLPASGGRADSLNPNGSSELALLMRRLAEFGEKNKAQILKNEKPEPWPSEVEALLTATPTDPEIKGAHYTDFANDFIQAARTFNLKLDKKKDWASAHNQVIGVCASCHGQSCAGPLVRIEKLFVN